jgi:hypothetical protein
VNAAILTSIYGQYDSLKPAMPQIGAEVEWIVVTDDPDLDPGLGWRVVVEPRPDLHPNRAAKAPKMLPWRYTDAPCSVWVDASFLVTSPTFVADVLALADPLAQFVHPWRDCVYAEAAASVGLPKYDGEPVLEQTAASYRAGHPPHFGLWATGVIARRHTPQVVQLGHRWLQECHRWSFQDQLSEPVVLREVGLRPASLPGTHLDNAWLAYQGSVRHG